VFIRYRSDSRCDVNKNIAERHAACCDAILRQHRVWRCAELTLTAATPASLRRNGAFAPTRIARVSAPDVLDDHPHWRE